MIMAAAMDMKIRRSFMTHVPQNRFFTCHMSYLISYLLLPARFMQHLPEFEFYMPLHK